MVMATRMKGLGRGLNALFDSPASSDGIPVAAAAGDALGTLHIDQLQPGKYQPRTRMDQEALTELADSIRAQGLIQPILVRPLNALATAPAGGANKANLRYEIIAGERRWRAARIAGLVEVPVVIREVPDNAALAMALIENIQREDLNAMEEAIGIQRLVDEFNLTHEEAARAIGRSRAATSNLLRLLGLAKSVQNLLTEGRIDMGHARALLGLSGHQQESVALRVAEQGLSVRATEQLVQDILKPKLGSKPRPLVSRDLLRFQEELCERLGTTVEIKAGKKGAGKLVISYSSNEHLDGLLARWK
jgi:ParB family chromosome partitioning protein